MKRATTLSIELALPPTGLHTVQARTLPDSEYCIPVRRLDSTKRFPGLGAWTLETFGKNDAWVREQEIHFTPETEGSTSMPNRSSDSELFAYVTAANGDNYRLTDSEVRRVIDYARQNYPALTWALASDPLQGNAERTFTVKFSVDVATYIRQQQDSEKKPETDTPLGAGLIKHLRSRGLAISATPDGINIVSLARKIPAPEEID